jgi:hypothetical protein
MVNFELPPRRPPPPQVDAAEFLALRTIVMYLILDMGANREASGTGAGQRWINYVAVRCQEALLSADVEGDDSAERIRRKAMEHVNHILGSIKFPNVRGDTN